jgi:uncharacterized phosphosugar-binding protein
LSARGYLEGVLPLIERLGTDLEEPIARSGEAVAAALVAGGKVWVAQTSHCLATEATYRAGGFMPAHILEDPVAVTERDCVIEGTPVGTSDLAVGIALAVKQRGATLIALTNVAFENDARTVIEHPSGMRLSEVADIVVDLAGPIGDGIFSTGDPEIQVIPHSGVTGMLAMWMIFAEAMSVMAADGLAPRFYQCVMVEGARERNNLQLGEYIGSDHGYETVDSVGNATGPDRTLLGGGQRKGP